MLHLGIETATRTCAAALIKEGALLAESSLNIKNIHAARLFELIESLFRSSGSDLKQLEAVSVSIGPGSFTGLRIGLASAKGIAMGLNIPVIPVSTLRALACQAPLSTGRIYPFIRARKNEYYTAAVLRTNWADEMEEVKILNPETAQEQLETPCMLIGDISEINITNPDILRAPAFANIPSARYIAGIGTEKLHRGDSPAYETLIPSYGQDFIAEKPKKRA